MTTVELEQTKRSVHVDDVSHHEKAPGEWMPLAIVGSRPSRHPMLDEGDDQ